MNGQDKIIEPPQAPNPNYPRYSTQPFPAYRFVPGLNPHPTEDTDGHSYGKKEEDLTDFDPQNWKENETYLYGVDLYNFAYWWESHEVLEGLWRELPKNDPVHNFLQGLIQISAAFIKWNLHEEKGVRLLYESATDYLRKAYQKNPSYMGVDLKAHMEKLSGHFKPALEKFSPWPNPLKDYPFLVLRREL